MAKGRVWQIAQELVVFLLLLLPFMLLLGSAEGTLERPTLVFWLALLVPLLLLPWLWARAASADRTRTEALAAQGSGLGERAAEFRAVVTPVLDSERAYVSGGVPVVEGRLRESSTRAFVRLEELLAPHHLTPLMEDRGDEGVRVLGLPAAAANRLRAHSSPAVHLLLFAATVVTTVWAGALHAGVNLLREPSQFMAGVPYAAALLAILGVHEMGHYIVARRHGVDVTPPYFIPVPMGLGTFGAFIQIRSLIRSRRAVFDIGIAGPLAGLVVAIPALYFGLRTSALAEAGSTVGVHSGSSFLLALIYQLARGGELGDAVVRLSPVAFAGWIGLFITALNLLPVGQLDGGHIAYGLFGRRHARMVGVVTFFAMLALGLTVWPGLLTFALLLALIAGFSHMPALDDVTPPDGTRFALGALAFAILVMILIPLPGGMRGLMLDCPYM